MMVRIVKIPGFYPVIVSGNTNHWNGEPAGGCKHGPAAWPWWRRFSWLWCEVGVTAPSWGRRLWFYTRRGAAYIDFIVDRRCALRGMERG